MTLARAADEQEPDPVAPAKTDCRGHGARRARIEHEPGAVRAGQSGQHDAASPQPTSGKDQDTVGQAQVPARPLDGAAHGRWRQRPAPAEGPGFRPPATGAPPGNRNAAGACGFQGALVGAGLPPRHQHHCTPGTRAQPRPDGRPRLPWTGRRSRVARQGSEGAVTCLARWRRRSSGIGVERIVP